MLQTNKIICGDCIEVMKTLPENSVDAIVTDPPYNLSSIVKRFGKKGSAPAQFGKDGSFSRLSKGFMGKEWDNEIAFGTEVWKEALRVLKPGGFLLSFGGTRTYHRLVCGIEDAGFEIRDTIMWLYGSGFPKSLNIGKQIDKMGAKDISWFGKWLREWREKKNITQKEIAKLFPSKTGGLTGCVANWELGLNIPTPEQFTKICRTFDLPFESIEEAEREIIGKKKTNRTVMQKIGETNTSGEVDITLPSTPEAKEWEGWGTALKPACEPIVVARKPLSEKNVALNVLKWGTGGINIDECRIDYQGKNDWDNTFRPSKNIDRNCWLKNKNRLARRDVIKQQGRFPANIILDEESSKLLDEQSGNCGGKWGNQGDKDNSVIPFSESQKGLEYLKQSERYKGDKGGASRFFYCAKASKSERNFGLENTDIKEKPIPINEPHNSKTLQERYKMVSKNNHPTVKPIALMQYLIKLVSREGAIVLDPFVGSGTTIIACIKLNRKSIGIEKESEYVKIANARIKPFLEQEKLLEPKT